MFPKHKGSRLLSNSLIYSKSLKNMQPSLLSHRNYTTHKKHGNRNQNNCESIVEKLRNRKNNLKQQMKIQHVMQYYQKPQKKPSRYEKSHQQSSINNNSQRRSFTQNPQLYKSKRNCFLTQQDQRQKTKVLWRDITSKNTKMNQKITFGRQNQQSPRSHKQSCNSFASLISKTKSPVKSRKQLEFMRNMYKKQILKNKSKQQIFQENMKIIMKVEDAPPRVDSWNSLTDRKQRKKYEQKLKNRNIQREQLATKLLTKNIQLIQKIQNTAPKIDPWNYYQPKKSTRELERQRSKQKLLQENFKMILKIQDTPPKVDSWNERKLPRNKKIIIEQKQQLLNKNIQIIMKIQNTPPKIQPWLTNKIELQNKLRKEKNDREIQRSNALDKIKRFIDAEEQRIKQQQTKDQLLQRRAKTLPAKPSNNLIQQKNQKRMRGWKFHKKYEIHNDKNYQRNRKMIELGTNLDKFGKKQNKISLLQELKKKKQAKQIEAMHPNIFNHLKFH